MKSEKKNLRTFGRAHAVAIAAGLSVAMIGGGVAVAQNVNLPNQEVVTASDCDQVESNGQPIAFGKKDTNGWVASKPGNFEGTGLMPGNKVFRSYAVRNLDARPLKWTIDMTNSQITDNAYFAIGTTISEPQPNAADADTTTIAYPAAPDAPQAETPADGFVWLIGPSVTGPGGQASKLTEDQRGTYKKEVIIPSGSYVTVTDWVAVPNSYDWTSQSQRINPVWHTTAQPGSLEGDVFTPAADTDPDFIPIGCEPTPTDTDTNSPVAVGSPETVTVGDTVDPKTLIKDADALPDGTTFVFKDPQPDFTTPGDKETTIVVTYPDGSTDEVTVTIPVTAAPKQTENNDPKAVASPETVTVGDTVDPKTLIKNADALPEGTTFEFKDPQPDFTTPGDKTATIVVTYPDGSTDEVPVTIPVQSQEQAYNPEAKPKDNVAELAIGGTPTAKDYIRNVAGLPANATYAFRDTPDTTTPGEKTATVVVTYPDGTTDEVQVVVRVKGATTQPKLSEQNDPQPVDVPKTVKQGDTVEPKDLIKDAGKLPAGTGFSFKAPAPDFTTPGTKSVTVVVTYPDSSTDEVSTTITVTEKTKPVPNNPSGSSLSDDCKSAVIGGSISSLLGLAIGIGSQLQLPGLQQLNTQIQQGIGIFNPTLASFAANWSSVIGGILGTVIFLLSLGTTLSKCKADLNSK